MLLLNFYLCVKFQSFPTSVFWIFNQQLSSQQHGVSDLVFQPLLKIFNPLYIRVIYPKHSSYHVLKPFESAQPVINYFLENSVHLKRLYLWYVQRNFSMDLSNNSIGCHKWASKLHYFWTDLSSSPWMFYVTRPPLPLFSSVFFASFRVHSFQNFNISFLNIFRHQTSRWFSTFFFTE